MPQTTYNRREIEWAFALSRSDTTKAEWAILRRVFDPYEWYDLTTILTRIGHTFGRVPARDTCENLPLCPLYK